MLASRDHARRGQLPMIHHAGLKPAAAYAFLAQGMIQLLQFFTAAITVLGVREVLSPAVRTLLWGGLGLNRVPAPWAKFSCGRKVLIALRTLVKDE